MSSGHFWCPFSGRIPEGAVRVGIDKDGSDLYVGRSFYKGELLPAKVIAQRRTANVSYDGREHVKTEFEVLCKGSTTVIWQESSRGNVPPGAPAVGRTINSEVLYAGRAFHGGILLPAKIHPSHGVCYVAFDGKEFSYPTYEALVLRH